ncbi:MAG TPA: T9SS type A sorting domain-containing protein [Flavobacterium sp.]|jgi:hypothetical protein|nr:T9SS type A sorting domain-containing protein [Flavobacterium sp.]HPJ11584.1 T9SS type A sorting domain-containing protein [Flavobacterium sp.]
MKYNLLLLFLGVSGICAAQSLVQSVNSGSLIAANTAVSVGEIVVNPVNPTQASSGLIGILAYNSATLEVAQFAVTESIVAYPNPTSSTISFSGKQSLVGEKVSVYNNVGQLALQQTVDSAESIDLAKLAAGIYLVVFDNNKINSFKIIKH